MYKRQTLARDDPPEMAASRNGRERSDSTSARTIRATVVQCVAAMDTTTAPRLPRNSATITMPSSRCGTALTVSTRRISSRSSQPPTAPASAPTAAPSTVEASAQAVATSSETRRPALARTNRSWPEPSVPNGWAGLGGRSTAA